MCAAACQKPSENKGLAGFLRPQESSENPIGWIHAPENGISHGKGVDAFAGNESRFVSNASKSGLPLSQQPAPRIKPVRGRHFRDLSQDRWAASSGLQQAAAFCAARRAFRKSPNPSNHICGRRLQTRKARSIAASVYSPLTTVRRSKTVPSPGQLTSQSRPRHKGTSVRRNRRRRRRLRGRRCIPQRRGCHRRGIYRPRCCAARLLWAQPPLGNMRRGKLVSGRMPLGTHLAGTRVAFP